MDQDYHLPPHHYPFPDPNAIFSGDLELHKKHFLPLLAIDTEFPDVGWKGQLHVVGVKESYEGLPGGWCPEHHNEHCISSRVAFKVDEHSRYTFLADFRFFICERGANPSSSGHDVSPAFVEQFVQHYSNVTQSYAESRAHYEETGFLNPWSAKQPERRLPWVKTDGPFLHTHRPNTRFVTRVECWRYYEGGGGAAELHFDPIDRIAYMLFD